MAKKYEELTFTDDFMFGKIMYNNPDLCKELLELILDKKLKKIRFPEVQKTVAITGDAKGVRLDVFTQDEEDKVYDVEMQTTKKKEIPRRSRYYHGVLDLNLLEKGMVYEQLPDCYVIFICTEDLGTEPVYFYSMRDKSDSNRELGDGSYTVFVNAEGNTDGQSPAMAEFLAYIRSGQVPEDETSFAARLQKQVIRARKHREWRAEYMFLTLREMDMLSEKEEACAKAREEGQEEGRKLGHEEGQNEINQLNSALLADKRLDDLARSLEDRAFQEDLLREYHIGKYGKEPC